METYLIMKADESAKLNKEYYQLLKEFETGNRRMKHIKKRMVEIKKKTDIKEMIVDERFDEILLKH